MIVDRTLLIFDPGRAPVKLAIDFLIDVIEFTRPFLNETTACKMYIILYQNNKRIFFRLSEIWNIFSQNMIKCHIFSRAGTVFYHIK
jgi:hypothetical protein